MDEHSSGRGSKFLKRVLDAGITWEVVARLSGDENLERRIKFVWKDTVKRCPVCTPHTRQTTSNGRKISDLTMWEDYFVNRKARKLPPVDKPVETQVKSEPDFYELPF